MSLLSSLKGAAETMSVLQRGTRVVENNLANLSTPGYARQRELFLARSYDDASGLYGGVRWGGTIDSRNVFAEHSVRDLMTSFGFSSKQADALARVEGLLPVGEGSGLPAAISKLFQSFSHLSVSPNDTAARQVAIDRAAELSGSLNRTANAIADARYSAFQDLNVTAGKINRLGEHLRDLNATIRRDASARLNSGLQADLYQTLEDLSQLTGATVLHQEDGTVSVYLGAQNLIVQGESFHPIQIDPNSAAARIVDDTGADITATLTNGEIGGLLDLHNRILPNHLADLNQLARGIADSVNGVLANGLDMTGNAPPVDLFSYDAMVGEARTLTVNAIQPQDLALASVGAPGGNGNALELARLTDAKVLNGFSFAGFYGAVAARVGRALETTRDESSIREALLLQAQNMRDDLSRVDMDEEAVTMIEFQRAYQATAQFVQAVNEMTRVILEQFR